MSSTEDQLQLSVDVVEQYTHDLRRKLETGHASEHAYRAALEGMVERLGRVEAVNDPKRSEHGAPDFVFLEPDGTKLIRGWAEAKDLHENLDKAEKTEQLARYAGYPNLFLTNYIDFRFFENGRRYEDITIAALHNGTLQPTPEEYEALVEAFADFFAKLPETITSGERLAVVMGAKARRIRHNVERYLSVESDKNEELLRIYSLIRARLVHDLTHDRFADMYAQTLVYGLFAARYNDATPATFSRAEARDLVPPSNPFLREFFDHIAGPHFDTRLARIVDELCAVFAASSVREIVHKRLGTSSAPTDDKDPIIHFYEDFLKAYDPALRKKMGVYYTPLPVVRFMVRAVNALLKQELAVPGGLADTSKTTATVAKQNKKVKVEFHKVQVLDPAVGTATFLNEIVNFIHAGFAHQEGRWSAYAKDDLIPRLNGFELMMASYTVAHLKLGLTLRESGVSDFGRRLGIYLTNALEEGMNIPQDLFSFGLADAVAQEAIQAGEVKTERPIMVVIGNPPYAGISSNETTWANALIDQYKVEPGGQRKLQERKHWLNDDYVKFIAFAEQMIKRTGSGVVAMITNHGYLDNPTFRGMRWRMMRSFDSLAVLDLHGNSKKKERSPDGGKDDNVFEIQQGVAILLGVMTGLKGSHDLATVRRADLWGTRAEKFARLNDDDVDWTGIQPSSPMYFFTDIPPEDDEYRSGVAIDELFMVYGTGIISARDSVVIDFDRNALEKRMEYFGSSSYSDDEVRRKLFGRKKAGRYLPGDSRGWQLAEARKAVANEDIPTKIEPMDYRPFDRRVIYYSASMVDWPRLELMGQMLAGTNIGLVVPRLIKEQPGAFITDAPIGHKLFSAYDSNSLFPLYLYDKEGKRTDNLEPRAFRKLTRELNGAVTPEEVVDYVYAVLHSPAYRDRHKNALKTAFPRVPIPTDDSEFKRLARIGRRLIDLHLMRAAECEELITSYPIAGTDRVESAAHREEKVWINSEQYFGNVSDDVWTMRIGGYQPAQKWLKDRKGRTLNSHELVHYQRIIAVLAATRSLMTEIDLRGAV
jgi:hypothetical protein